uniref:Uncharacterized protein n=1 Tax=Onchocerca volvulus TaxID=6282 RepID=A0A8R1Y1U6_ONCVO
MKETSDYDGRHTTSFPFKAALLIVRLMPLYATMGN